MQIGRPRLRFRSSSDAAADPTAISRPRAGEESGDRVIGENGHQERAHGKQDPDTAYDQRSMSGQVKSHRAQPDCSGDHSNNASLRKKIHAVARASTALLISSSTSLQRTCGRTARPNRLSAIPHLHRPFRSGRSPTCVHNGPPRALGNDSWFLADDSEIQTGHLILEHRGDDGR